MELSTIAVHYRALCVIKAAVVSARPFENYTDLGRLHSGLCRTTNREPGHWVRFRDSSPSRVSNSILIPHRAVEPERNFESIALTCRLGLQLIFVLSEHRVAITSDVWRSCLSLDLLFAMT
jgi:hypothetical protein